MAIIDGDDYVKTIHQLLVSKSRLIKAKDKWDRQNKLKRYLASKGYETDLIHDAVNEFELL